MKTSDLRRYAPATARNRDPILQVLRSLLPSRGLLLEIASGSGEHAVFFADAFPQLTWQPSDPDPACRGSIEGHRAAAGLENVASPLNLDVRAADWPVERPDVIFCANMLHIAPWASTEGLMAGAGRHLMPGGGLCIYGPFIREDRETAPSNLAFDQSLRAQNPAWGLRRLVDVEALAVAAGLSLAEAIEMPANNLILWFKMAGPS